jgi:chemotaxis signal transduction protein
MLEIPSPSRTETGSPISEHPVGRSDRLVIFQLGHALYAVAVDTVQEIALMAYCSSVAGMPSLLAGFLNLRQRPIPIIRLHRLLAHPESAPGLYTHILVFRESSGPGVGWVVDRVTQIIPKAKANIVPLPEGHSFKDYAQGAFHLDGVDIIVLSPARVLLEQERQAIREFAAMEQTRLHELEGLGA